MCPRILAALGIFAPAGFGAVIGTPLGSGPAPGIVGGITMIAAPLDQPDGVYRPPLGANVTHAPSVRGSVVFNAPRYHRRIGQGWTNWGHDYAGDVYVVPGAGTKTQLTLPAGSDGNPACV